RAGQGVKDLSQGAVVRFLSEDIEETRQVVAVGDLVLTGNADEATQRGVAVEFGEAIAEGVMPQQDGQDNDVPHALDGVVVAAVSAGLFETGKELLVG